MGLIRFQLALFVALAHARLLPLSDSLGGEIGPIRGTTAVQMFFVMSGFYMHAAYQKNYLGDWKRFICSRYARLWPSYAAAVLISFAFYLVLAAAFPGYPLEGMNRLRQFNYFVDFGSLPAAFHFSALSMVGQDLLSIDGILHRALPNRVGWSISAEMIFYASVPILALCSMRALALIVLGSAVLKLAIFWSLGFRASYFPFYAEIVYFFAGYAAYGVNRRLADIRTSPLPYIVCLSGAYLAMYTLGDAAFEHDIARSLVITGFFLALLLTTPFRREGRLGRTLGDASYLLYLLHFPFLAFFLDMVGSGPASRGAAIAAAVVAALLLERFFQKPIDEWRRRVLWKRSLPPKRDAAEETLDLAPVGEGPYRR